MFSLNRLKLNNWCQHTDSVIDFAPGTNGIIGANGRGKSNILAAVFALLTGKTLTDTLPEAINYNADSTSNELDFTIDGTPGSIKRKFTATRQDGNPNNRNNVSSSAALVFGSDIKVKGVSAVNNQLDELAGFNANMLQTHVFITQDTMSELLFQPAQERLKSFMALIPDLARAEKMRAALMAEMGLFPDTTLVASSKEYDERAAAAKQELDVCTKALESAQADMAAIDITSAKEIMAIEARVRAVNIPALQDKVDELTARHNDVTVALGTKDKQVQELRAALPPDSNDLEELKATLVRAKLNRDTAARLQQTRAAMEALISEVNTRQAPVNTSELSDAEVSTIRATISELTGAIAVHQKVLAVLQAGGTCPTCGNTFEDPDKQRKEHSDAATVLSQQHNELTAKLSAEEERRSAYSSQLATHNAWINNAEAKLMSYQRELSQVPAGEILDDTAMATLSDRINAIQTLQQQVHAGEQESVSLASQLSNISERLQDVEDQLSAAKATVAEAPDKSVMISAVNAVNAYNELTTKVAELKGTAAGHQRYLNDCLKAADDARAAEERIKAVARYKNILSAARDVLHRDKLPEEVLASYITGLESACNKFLNMFDSPFAVMIGRGMNIRCTLPNGYTCSARRLSAGQKCVLSVAMRFAINELFAGNFGLIILDEPTAFMDDTNIEYMRELISYIRNMSKTTGIQTIIITHHKELISSFDNVISV